MQKGGRGKPRIPAAETETGPTVHYEEAADIQGHFESDGAVVDESEDVDDQLVDSDVYRGEPPSVPPLQLSPLPRQTTLTFETRSIASSDSSSSVNVGRRIGAIALAVEQAISRWARTHSSGSSTTSSSSASSSSASSRRTRSTRKKHTRKHAESVSIHNAARERELQERKRVHEESRVTPREFTLFLPPELAYTQLRKTALDASIPSGPSTFDGSKRVMQTTSLPDILAKLDSALKQSSRARKARLKGASTHDTSQKGKNKCQESHGRTGGNSGAHKPSASAGATASKSQRGWWLDVTSPTWDDLRSIGKVR